MHTRKLVGWIVLGCLLCSSAKAQVTGVVRDDLTNAPIEGALVSQQATAFRTVTDANGNFELNTQGQDPVVVAAKKGYFNESVNPGGRGNEIEIRLESVPQTDDPNYTFQVPAACQGCHPDQYSQWNGSPMAKAGGNLWMYDIFNGTGTPGGMGGFVYTRDSIHATKNPESECASCHQPEPWINTPHTALEDINDLSAGSLHGISCEVCHKIADIDISRPNFPGIYPGSVTVTRPQGPQFHQVQYGVLGDTDFRADTLMRSSYQPQLASEVCAACHQDKNDPDGDGDFEEPNGVISEPTYLEWLASPYGDPSSTHYAECVECHMPAFGASQVSPVLSLNRNPETIRSHRIEGTTPEYLENAVDLHLVGERVGSSLEVDVTITNTRTGHHVPTGVTIRNMILLLEAWRESDQLPLVSQGTQVIHDLGGIGDPAQGYYAGLPGKFYAKVNHNKDLQGPTFFTDATGLQFDNRIHALDSDSTNYTFQVPAGGGELHIRARLIYRRSFRFLTDAKGWTVDGHGNPLADVAPPHFGHLMEEKEWICQTDLGLVDVLPSLGSEGGDTHVNLFGCGFTDIADTTVSFGGQPATIVEVIGGRVAVRTPPGTGTVDVTVTNSNGTRTAVGAHTYVEPGMASRFGNINIRRGDRENILLLNDSAGDQNRVVHVPLGTQFNLQMLAPQTRAGSRFVLYAFLGAPSNVSATALSNDLGLMSFAPTFAGGTPFRVWTQLRGTAGVADFPSSPAPSRIFWSQGRTLPFTATFQGIVRDDASRAAIGFSISNSVTLDVQ